MPALTDNHLLRSLRRTLDIILVGGFAVMSVATLGQVLFRYFLHFPATWTEELARATFVMITYFAMAVAVRDKDHIVVDFLLVKLPPRARALLLITFDVVIVAFLALVARGALLMAERMWTAELTMLDGVTQGHLYLGELIAILLMMLYAALDIAVQVRALRGGPVATLPAAGASLDRDLR
ncbi:MAG TPA: TRAP transporter small permease [Alphaproteobacteria bacterium]|nr:TRAP transporter small permease [Alphaproteobacteria bacterium]